MRSTILVVVTTAVLAACGGPQKAPPPPAGLDDAITYRALSTHPGCTTAGLSYPAANIAGYSCAAKEYAFPSGVSEDTTKPIVILVHGNSSSPADFEAYTGSCSNTGIPTPNQGPMLAEKLVALGFHTIAVDMRIDKVDDPTDQNPARNIDHGWSTPIVQSLIQAVMNDFPNRKITVIGFSLGSTIIPDAFRRLHLAGVEVFPRLQDVILAAGAHHGVSTYRKYCINQPYMNSEAACQLGDRTSYVPTPFLSADNGASDVWDTPCSDGKTAYGETTASICANNTVRYTTIVMRDISQGTYQDEFVSQASAALQGADNQLIQLTDQDQSCYFVNGAFMNHFGSIRSAAALNIILGKMTGQ